MGEIKKLPVEIRINLILSLIEEINKLHKMHLVHRDIKPENIIYDPEKNKLSLIDYSSTIDEKQYQTDPPSDHMFVGTPAYWFRQQVHPREQLPDVHVGVDLCAARIIHTQMFPELFDITREKLRSVGRKFDTLDVSRKKTSTDSGLTEQTPVFKIYDELSKIYLGADSAERKTKSEAALDSLEKFRIVNKKVKIIEALNMYQKMVENTNFMVTWFHRRTGPLDEKLCAVRDAITALKAIEEGSVTEDTINQCVQPLIENTRYNESRLGLVLRDIQSILDTGDKLPRRSLKEKEAIASRDMHFRQFTL